MPKVIAIKPKIGDLVYFYRNDLPCIRGPYRFMGGERFMNIHTKEVVGKIGMVCDVEPETVVYNSELEMVKKLQKMIVEEIKNS